MRLGEFLERRNKLVKNMGKRKQIRPVIRG